MKKSKTYVFNEWNRWEDELFQTVKEFYAEHLSYPNILMANPHTFSQIDYISNINPEKRKNIKLMLDDESVDSIQSSLETDYKELKGIQLDSNCSLDFAEDRSLKDSEYILVCDDNPDWGDNPDLIPRNPEKKKTQVKQS